ncbi:MAG: Mfa1 fimbrilin C-terminal domain-containing protein, partial [Allobaculum sp.]|nr:Mfa1 fimbrilin C-terminal domain-containing protein [Allobaculum sp.]
TWYTTRVEDVVSNKDGKYPTDGTGNYNRWRYVTENTIPYDRANQVNSWSTGIVFKAKLKAGNALESSTDRWDVALKNTLNNTQANGPILYFFAGKLYCGWDHVVAAALAAAGFDETKGQDQHLDRAASLFKAVYGNGGVGEIKDADDKVIFTDDEKDAEGNLLYPVDSSSPNALYGAWNGGPTQNNTAWNAFRDAVVGATFTIYEKYGDSVDGWGYYCYYFYWNRHNDNYQNGVMAPMEFATVRNNVYKLAVTRLNTLGHPRIPENDPDSPTPDTPDEKSDLYLTVSVQVLPWVVRFNNIEFW